LPPNHLEDGTVHVLISPSKLSSGSLGAHIKLPYHSLYETEVKYVSPTISWMDLTLVIQSLIVPPCMSSMAVCGTGVHAVFQKTETGFPLLMLIEPWKKCTRVNYKNTNCSKNAVTMSKYNGDVTETPRSKLIKTYNNFSARLK